MDSTRAWRVLSKKARLLTAGTVAALLAVPVTAAASQASVSASLTSEASASCPWVTSHAPVSQRVAQLMGQMSLADEISMVEGHGTTNPYVFYTPAIPALCIPAVGEEDGPAGVADGLTGVTQLPAGVALAATWDPSLAERYGQVIGAEEYGKGASVNLGPTVNIDRDPRSGRSFEALSEDPFLNASLDVPEIRGVQGQDVLSQVKHLAVYNQETYRNTPANNVIINARTEHEIYLPSFYAAVKSGDASVMCSYAVINGDFACNDADLETSVLRDAWGFGGFVTSDYAALHSPESGTTLLKNAGSVLPLSSGGSIAVVGPAADASATYAGGGSAYVLPSGTVSPLAGIKAAAGSGTGVAYQPGLPADTSLPAIPSADLSPAYAPTPFGGSYTGTLTAPETGTYVLALTNPCGCYTSTYLSLDGKQIIDDPSTPPVHTYSVAVQLTAGKTYTLSISGDSSQLLWGTPSALAPGIAAAVSAAKSASVAVVVVSDDTESEATDRPSLNLPSAQDELISAVAAANPHTVVVVNAGAPVAMPWLPAVAGVLDTWYPGQTSGTALASVLFGQTDPGGHLPVTFPASLSQVPASTTAQFPGNGSTVQYSEGVDVGYRWYDAKSIAPLYPFGFGLSYTRFAFSHLSVSRQVTDGTQDVRVSAVVTNTGHRTGSEVAQFYLGDPAGTGEPPRQLAGFQRVSLAPGASARVSFVLTPREESWWDDAAKGWTQTAGQYQVFVGDSSALADLPLRGSFSMPATPGARQVTVSAPSAMQAGKAAAVRVTLTAAGTATLHGVRLALQLPQGWRAAPAGPAVFGSVAPGQAVAVTFQVTPPGYAPNATAVVHATATTGGWLREAGANVTVSG